MAWWYLTCGPGNAHCFIAVFVHNVRDELMVCIAEGKSSMLGFPKDDYITKQGWCYESGSLTTRRQAYGRALKYAYEIVRERINRDFKCAAHSFNENTGTDEDAAMSRWERIHDTLQNLTLSQTPRPDWWPTKGNLWWMPNRSLERREDLHQEGFDLVGLVNSAHSATSKRRRKKRNHARTYRRVGRFLVRAKD